MALDRVFIGPLKNGRVDNPDAAAHVRKVLRLRNGDTFAGYDGECGYELKLLGGSASGLEVEVLSRSELPRPAAEVVLAPALLKGRRWETLLEKAVELGAAAVWPVAAERSVVNLKAGDAAAKTGRWEKIMQAASAQCAGRLPGLEAPAPFAEVLERAADARSRIILSAGEGAAPAAQIGEAAASGKVVILSGPEGDWTEAELAEAEKAGFKRVGLGPRILRSETAALAALAIASALQERTDV